jgi:putative transposase
LCCDIYNSALEQRRTWYRKTGKSVTYNDQTVQLTDLRTEVEFAALPVEVARSALRRLDQSFKAFFRRVKSASAKAGFPRFRARDRYSTIGLGRRKIKRDPNDSRNAWLSLPDRSLVRFRMHRETVGEIRDVSLTRDARGRWFVLFQCDVGDSVAKVVAAPERATGIDVGLTHFATLADGSTVANPRFFKHAQAGLARIQHEFSRKTRGSSSRRKAKAAVARAYERTQNARKNFHFHTVRDLLRRYDLVCFEDLDITGLVKLGLAKHILDAGWGQFLAILVCKAEEAGKWAIAVDPRGTTQECSDCGVVVPKGLGDRTHKCDCGLTLGRDHNAAINILARGLRAVPRCEAGPVPQMRQSPT